MTLSSYVALINISKLDALLPLEETIQNLSEELLLKLDEPNDGLEL